MLDLIRAAAIVLVVLRHGYQAYVSLPGHPQRWFAFAENIALNGWLGVDIFFVLSGFLLSRQLLDKPLDGDRWRVITQFWSRRAYRILPCYLLIIVGLWLLHELDFGEDGATGPLELLKHLLFLQDYFRSGLLVTTWSLATEVKFYLLLPFLVLAARHNSKKGFAASLALLSLVVLCCRLAYCVYINPIYYSDFFWQVRAPFTFSLDGLLLGVCTGFLSLGSRARHPDLQRGRSVVVSLLFISGIGGLGAINWLDRSFVFSTIAIWAISALTATILAVGASSALAFFSGSMLGRLSSWMAAISYPLYLVHYPIVDIAKRVAAQENTIFSAATLFWFFYVVTSIFLAWLLHLSVELPFLRMRDEKQALPADAKPLAGPR